jgi:hypothetical protein
MQLWYFGVAIRAAIRPRIVRLVATRIADSRDRCQKERKAPEFGIGIEVQEPQLSLRVFTH